MSVPPSRPLLLRPAVTALGLTLSCAVGAFACSRTPVISALPDDSLSTRPHHLRDWQADPGELDDSALPTLDPGSPPQLEASGGSLPGGPTQVHTTIRGTHAEVVLRRQFRSDRPIQISAEYGLRLPDQAILLGYRLKVNDRVFDSKVVDATALLQHCEPEDPGQRRDYRHNRDLAIEAPGPWLRQEISEVPPGAVIETELRYMQNLAYSRGAVEFATPAASDPRGGFEVTVDAIALGPIDAWTLPNHPEATAQVDGAAMRLSYRSRARSDGLFLLRYRSASDQPHGAVFLAPPDSSGEGAFLLEVEPPALAVRPREFVFVLQTGNDAGRLRQGAVLAQLLTHLRPSDRLQLYQVGSQPTRSLATAPLPATQANLVRADVWAAGHASEESPKVSLFAAVTAPPPPGFDRLVFVFVDSYGFLDAANPIALARAIRAAIPSARVFPIELSDPPQLSAPERRAAVLFGASTPLIIDNARSLLAETRRVSAYFDPIVLGEVAVDWGALQMRPLPHRLFLSAGEPLRVIGRYSSSSPPPAIELRGSAADELHVLTLPVYRSETAGAGLTALPSVERVASLVIEADLTVTERAQSYESGTLSALKQRIATIGVEGQLLTPMTSFLAMTPGRTPVIAPVDPSICSQSEAALRGWTHQSPRRWCGGPWPYGVGPPRPARESVMLADLSPRAVEDAGGVGLAGTPSAESIVYVDGVPIPNAVTNVTADEGAGAPPIAEPITVETTARTRILGSGPQNSGRKRLVQALKAERHTLAQCFLAAPRSEYRVRQKLALRASWSPLVGLEGLEVVAPHEVPPLTLACLKNHIDEIAQTTLHAEEAGPIALTVRVWMTF